MQDMLYKYFIEPIWARTGYNLVNTITYAIIALVLLYAIWLIFKKYNIKIDKKFIYNIMPFVLLGSTVRVVTDAIDNGVFAGITPIHQMILTSHIYDYGYLTVSPGIYIVVTLLLFATMVILWKIKKPELLGTIGIVLWLPHFILLLPFMQFAVYVIPIILLAAVPTYLALKYFKSDIYALIVGGHALDGAATFFAIDIFSKISGISYGEQHVVSNAIGELFSTYFAFYLIKIMLAFGVAYLISKEKEIKEEERNYLALIVMIMGFAPGIRGILRMAVGA